MIRRLFASFALTLLLCLSGWATTYYVNTAADPGGDGTTQELTGAHCAWDTIADVNAASFSAGDSVLFAKGCTWREQLTVPSSGSAGLPITFGAYGTGDDPIINGADVTSTWTAYSGSYATGYSASLTVDADYGGTTVDLNYRQGITSTVAGTTIKVTFTAHGTQNTLISAAAIGIRSGTTDDFTGAPTVITFDSGQASKTITAGSTATSDAITYTIATGTTYLIAVWSDQNTYVKLAYTDGINYFKNSNGQSDESQTVTVSGYTANAYKQGISKIDVLTPLTNVWQVTCNTEPNAVYFDGILGVLQASAAACTATGYWYWASSVLYVYSTSDPDSAYTDPGIEVTSRNPCINLSAKDYITFDGLHIQYAKGNGIYALNSNAITISNCTVTGCSGSSNTYQIYMIAFGATSDVLTINDCILKDAVPGGPGGLCIYAVTNIDIDDVTINDIEGSTSTAGSGIIISQAVTGRLDNCDVLHSGGKVGRGFGFCFLGAADVDCYDCKVDGMEDGFDAFNTATITLTRCVAKNCGILSQATSGDGFASHDTSDLKLYYCLGHDNWRTGISSSTPSTGTAYNCTFSNNYKSDGSTSCGILLVGSCVWTIKNCITSGHTYEMYWQDTSTATQDYNCFYPRGGVANTAFYYHGTAKNFTDWKTATSQDSHSLCSDPLFISTVTPNFTLQSSSPCINAGTDVGLTMDYVGTRIPQGPKPDIGAYEQLRRTFLLFLDRSLTWQ